MPGDEPVQVGLDEEHAIETRHYTIHSGQAGTGSLPVLVPGLDLLPAGMVTRRWDRFGYVVGTPGQMRVQEGPCQSDQLGARRATVGCRQ